MLILTCSNVLFLYFFAPWWDDADAESRVPSSQESRATKRFPLLSLEKVRLQCLLPGTLPSELLTFFCFSFFFFFNIVWHVVYTVDWTFDLSDARCFALMLPISRGFTEHKYAVLLCIVQVKHGDTFATPNTFLVNSKQKAIELLEEWVPFFLEEK